MTWLGHVGDQELLTELWQNTSVLIHGHSVGGTNPALLQALGAGAPTIALETAFNREVLQNQDQLFTHNDQALADKVIEVSGNKERQRSLKARGRQIAETRYRWDATLEAYRDLLSDLARN
jgi:glycosyltransferase involved in cell wall biosynthesis